MTWWRRRCVSINQQKQIDKISFYEIFLQALYLYEYTVLSQESKRSYVCVLRISNLPLSTIFLLNFGTVPTMWYFFDFHFIIGCENTIMMIYRLLLLTTGLKLQYLRKQLLRPVIKIVKMKYNRFDIKWWRVATSFKIHF